MRRGLCEELSRKFCENCGAVGRKKERKVALTSNESLAQAKHCSVTSVSPPLVSALRVDSK